MENNHKSEDLNSKDQAEEAIEPQNEQADISEAAKNLKEPEEFKLKLEKAKGQNEKTSGLSYFALILAFLLPPIGLIVSMVARAKSKNTNRPAGLATAALVISTILFLSILGSGGYYIYREYNKSNNKQFSNESVSQTNGNSKNNNYTDNEKKAIAQSEQFLNFIKTEDYASAFKMLSPELQKEYINGESDFSKEVTTANLKLIDSWSVSEAITNGNQDRFTVNGTATFRGSTPNGKFEFQFYKDSNGSIKMFLWQISPNS